jgi:PEGA domain
MRRLRARALCRVRSRFHIPPVRAFHQRSKLSEVSAASGSIVPGLSEACLWRIAPCHVSDFIFLFNSLTLNSSTSGVNSSGRAQSRISTTERFIRIFPAGRTYMIIIVCSSSGELCNTASHSQLRLFILVTLLACPAHALADKLRITSNPTGASVEIDGVAMGTTPFEKKYPGGYFHKTKTAFGARLEHPMVARISLSGYSTKELTLTEGPMLWVFLYGRVRAEYWPLKSGHFHAELQPVSDTFTGEISAAVSGGRVLSRRN